MQLPPMHFCSSITSTESALDPALFLFTWRGRGAWRIERIVAGRAIEFDGLARVVGNIIVNCHGSGFLGVRALVCVVWGEGLCRTRLAHPQLVGIWVVVAKVVGLAELVQLVEGAVLRAGVGRLAILLGTRSRSLVRVLVGVCGNGTVAIVKAIVHTVAVGRTIMRV